MTTTAQHWIDQTRNMLLSGYVEELLTLTTPPASLAATTMTITGANDSGIVPGIVIEIGSELFYVTNVTGTTVSVMRGYAGTTAVVHNVNDIVRVSPKFPEHRIIDELNNDLADLSAPDNGIFDMKTFTFTYQGGVDGYEVAGITNDQLSSIYQVTYAALGVVADEPEVINWKLRRNRDTSVFSSGLALVLYSGVTPGRLVTAMYKSPLTSITSSASTKISTGLPTTAYDLPPLGAALSLMVSTPIRREFLDAQGSSRRAEEVPPGAIAGSMRDLRSKRSIRVESEASRLAQMYPQLWHRNSAVGNTGVFANLGRRR